MKKTWKKVMAGMCAATMMLSSLYISPVETEAAILTLPTADAENEWYTTWNGLDVKFETMANGADGDAIIGATGDATTTSLTDPERLFDGKTDVNAEIRLKTSWWGGVVQVGDYLKVTLKEATDLKKIEFNVAISNNQTNGYGYNSKLQVRYNSSAEDEWTDLNVDTSGNLSKVSYTAAGDELNSVVEVRLVNGTYKGNVFVTISEITLLYDMEAPTVPVNLTAGSVTESMATVTWDEATDNVGVVKYNVYSKKTDEADYVLVATVGVDDRSYSLSGLDSEAAYDVAVTAVDANGNESEKAIVSFATLKHYSSELVGSIYEVKDSILYVPYTEKNPTTVGEVLSNVTVADLATAAVKNGETVLDSTAAVADGNVLLITAGNGGSTTTYTIRQKNQYHWTLDYVDAQQGNVWFSQQKNGSDEWFNMTSYDGTYPNWVINTWYGVGVDAQTHGTTMTDEVHGLISATPNTTISTAMAFKAPKTGTVSFKVYDDEPYLRQTGNSGGTVTLSLLKNDEVLQSVTLTESNVQATDWKSFDAIEVEAGDYIRVTAACNSNPSRPSVHVTPIITYVDVEETKEYLTVSADAVLGEGNATIAVPEEKTADTLELGDRVTVTAAAEEGYEFLYWMDTETKVIYSEEAEYTFDVVRSISLKAVFAEKENGSVVITFMTDSRFSDKLIGEAVAEGGKVQLPKAPEFTKYDFTGWDTDGDGTADIPADATEADAEETATWICCYTANDNCKLTVTGGTVVYEGEEAINKEGVTEYRQGTKLAVVADEGEGNFAGWYADEAGTELLSANEEYWFIIKSDMTIYAVWTEEAVEVTGPVVTTSVQERTRTAEGKDKVRMGISWSTPEGYTVLGEGIVRTYGTDDSSADLLVLGTTASGVTTNQCKNVTPNGSYTYNLNIGASSANKTKTVYAVGYVRYQNDETGEIKVAYSNVMKLAPLD